MRIVQVNAVYGIGSTGRTCKELHDYALAHGHECLTFYGNHKGNYGPEAVFMGSTQSHKLHAVTGRLAGDWGVGSWTATRRLIKRLRDYSPDVVNLRNLHGNYVNFEMLLGYLAKHDIPTIVSLDDFMPMTGGCEHFTLNGCNGWQRDCSNCRHLARGRNYIFANNAAAAFERRRRLFNSIPRLGVLGVSQWTASLAKKSPVFANARFVDYVYNWIDLNVFKPQGEAADLETRARLGIGDRRMILGVSSGWDNRKGLDKFIELAKLLGDSYRIVLVGRMAKDIVLPENIIAVSATDSARQLVRYYSAADVFVHLSLQETFGKVVSEALACGTPAIVYNSTALPELVDENTGVVLETSASVYEIERKIKDIYSRNLHELKQACTQRAETLFSLSDNCAEFMSFYGNLINQCN